MLIKEFLDKQKIDILVSEAKKNGIDIVFTNKEGVPILNDLSTFCKKEHDAYCCKKCLTENRFAIEESLRFGDVYLMSAHTGLVFIAIAVMINQEIIGGIVSGRMMPIELIGIFKDRKNTQNKIDEHYLENDLIPKKDSASLENARNELFRIALKYNLINESCFRHQKNINNQELKIAGFIHRNKSKSNINNYTLYKYRERELINKIKSGDKRGATNILNELLVVVYSGMLLDFEVIKAYMTELLVVISRAAIESGTPSDRLFGMNYSFFSELGSIDNQVDLTYWIVKVLENYIDEVSKCGSVTTRMHAVIEYIYEHCKEHISLGKIAFMAKLSPSHFAHEFKKETGMSFITFINDIKLKKASDLLTSKSMSIIEIAMEMGYSDQSYFIRQFKNKFGLTPLEYRRLSKRNGKI